MTCSVTDVLITSHFSQKRCKDKTEGIVARNITSLKQSLWLPIYGAITLPEGQFRHHSKTAGTKSWATLGNFDPNGSTFECTVAGQHLFKSSNTQVINMSNCNATVGVFKCSAMPTPYIFLHIYF